MTIALNILAGLVLLLVGIPAALWIIQVFIACLLGMPKRPDWLDTSESNQNEDARPPAWIVIPAHNESNGLIPTLVSLTSQTLPNDRVLVVADNCNDDTAQVARDFGAEVVERQNPDERGKGYALDYGFNHLGDLTGKIIIVMDADCIAEPNCIDTLTRQAHRTRRPIQAVYLMRSQQGDEQVDSISTLAFRFKNLVRPLGLFHLRQACQLTGSGMAMPPEAIQGVTIGSSEIVEDMVMGLHMAANKHVPMLSPWAWVWSDPAVGQAEQSQRTRWEHGHLQSIFRDGPHTIFKGLCTGHIRLFTMGLDLLIPPLALLGAGLAGSVLLSLITWLITGMPYILCASGTLFILMLLALGLGTARFAGGLAGLKLFMLIPWYMLKKLPIYTKFLTKRQQQWVRTDRKETP